MTYTRIGSLTLIGVLALVGSFHPQDPISASPQFEHHRSTDQRPPEHVMTEGRDISSTARGRQVAREASRHLKDEQDISEPSSTLRVIEMDSPVGVDDFLVLPIGVEIVDFQSDTNDGVHVESGRISIYQLSPESPSGTTELAHGHPATLDNTSGATTSSYTGWEEQARRCLTRWRKRSGSVDTGWMDICWVMNLYKNDGSNTHNWWAFYNFATFRSLPGWATTEATLKHSPQRYSQFSWADWSPRSDTTRACQPVSVAINILSALSYTATQCDLWDINKSTLAGTFRNTWKGYAHQSEREVAFHTSVRTPQAYGTNQRPVWDIEWEMTNILRR